MFNLELKTRYIEEKSNQAVLPVNYLECQFNKLERIEDELKKDIYDFTVNEIIDFYKSLNISSLEVLAVLNSHLSLYTDWCLQQNLVKDNQNHFLLIDLDVMKGCLNKALLNKKVVSREEVIKWSEQLPNPRDQVILLGLFEGMKGKDFCDFVNLKPIDINGNKITLHNGRKIIISDRLLNYIRESIKENIYYSVSGSLVKTMSLIDRGYVIKDYPNTRKDTSDFIRGRVIYNSIARSLKYVGVIKFISANNIFDSGKIYMIKKRAEELGITSKEYIYSNHIEEVEYRYNTKIVKSNFWLKYQDYL